MSLKRQGKYRFQDFEVDLGDRSLRRDGRAITIGSRTFDLLAFLVSHLQRVLSRDELMDALWPGSYAEESSLSRQVFLLCKALTGLQPGDKLLAAVPGRGYRFTPAVTAVAGNGAGIHAAEAGHSFQTIGHATVPATLAPENDAELKKDGLDLLPSSHSPQQGLWSRIIFVVVMAILGSGAFFAWRWVHRARPQSLGVVLADIQNTTGNPQFDEALNTALSIDLEQSPFLAVASRAGAAQALSARDEKKADAIAEPNAGLDQSLTPEQAREACMRLNRQAYLTGDVRRFLAKYMVSLQAFDCASGRKLASSKGIADTPDGIVAVLDKVAADLRGQLSHEPSGAIERFSKPLFAGRAASLEALKAYADAIHLESAGKQVESVTLLQHAVEIDPLFTLAFAELGAIYNNLGEHDLAIAALTRAYELRDSVDEPHRFQIISAYNDAVTGDIQSNIHNYQAWSEEYPHNPVPFIGLAAREIEIGEPILAIAPARRSLQLDAADPAAYAMLARAQLHLGQYEEAARTCQLAIQRGVDDEQIHSLLMQTAFLRLDQPGMDAQLAWAKDKPAELPMRLQSARIDFAQGKTRAALAAFAGVIDSYRKQGEMQQANRVSGMLPRIEAELGFNEIARAQLAGLSAITGSYDIPVAWAEVGEIARADAAAARELDAHPADTLWQEYRVPQIRAAIALTQGKPAAAIEALASAAPFDLRSFEAPSMRGRAFLAARQPRLAEAEFHKILDHPGIEPYSHNYPLAQLGLARALAQEGKMAEAGLAYKLVLQIWKDADPDLPRLREARAEYARLGAGGSPVVVLPAGRKQAPGK